jgi:sugar lactone lactonase YvrE
LYKKGANQAFFLFNEDADGWLWVALSGASRVVRINPTNGVVDMTVHLPVSSPTSLTFGGPMLDELFITTRGPDGGSLYRAKLPFGIRGLPEPEYRFSNIT